MGIDMSDKKNLNYKILFDSFLDQHEYFFKTTMSAIIQAEVDKNHENIVVFLEELLKTIDKHPRKENLIGLRIITEEYMTLFNTDNLKYIC
ncbi:hypothetical protein HYI36_14560 [Bacillus sp. Gen3]|nr:hypothetical protein [Heyndrickxia oleronia]NYV66486.1 hypothetical protein [Bacillus sp. Gen3]